MQHRFLVLILFILSSFSLSAQKTDHDLGSWMYADATWSTHKWAFTGGLEYRMNNNISDSQLYSFLVLAKYRSSKLLRLSYMYEFFANDDAQQNIYVDHRTMVQAELFFSFSNFRIANRTSFMDSFKRIQHPNWGLRDRVQVGYPVKRWEPFVYYEGYFQVKDSSLKHQKNRYATGLSYEVNTKNSLSLYYMAENVPQKSFTLHVLGVSYALALN